MRDGALLGLGQRFDLFELLLNLRRRPALAGLGALGGGADQVIDRNLEQVGELGQGAGQQAQAAGTKGPE